MFYLEDSYSRIEGFHTTWFIIMDITIYPRKLHGTIAAIPSKSQAHRLLICAAFSDRPTTIVCPETNQDIEATANCLRALGAEIDRKDGTYFVVPIKQIPTCAELDCSESGSTLRFMLPIVGALGINGKFFLSGRLPDRPLSPLWEEMERMGCKLSRPAKNTLQCNGQLVSGHYKISGTVSSQYITGLLFALSLLPGHSTLEIEGKLESKPYVNMTQQALDLFAVNTDMLHLGASYPFHSPGQICVEGDWSNAAFFCVAQYLGSELSITGLSDHSAQGDRAIATLLAALNERPVIDAADIPDLVPILAVAAGAATGAVFKNIRRLRLKESDRVLTVINMLKQLGVSAYATDDVLFVEHGPYHGGTIDAASDHRIAMAAAIASTVADGPITILGAQCVAKSYPAFWDEFRRLGGHYEQYIR